MRDGRCRAGLDAPATFDEDHMDEWSLWVLENGLPELPVSVKKGESVPVARWAGHTVGAVLHVQWMCDHDDSDAHHRAPEEDDFLASEVTCFYRVDGVWQEGNARGGSGWYSALLERSHHIGAAETREFGLHGEGGRCLALYGIMGTAARFIEVETGGRVEQAPLESPIGAWIAAWEPALAATVRILGDGDALLYSRSYAPWPLYTTGGG
jgi:hypothetical protein